LLCVSKNSKAIQMKKLALMSTLASLGAISAMAQGNFVFQNSSAFPVKVATGTDAASLAGATAIGTANTILTGPQVTIELFAAANGAAGLELNSSVTSPFYVAAVTMSGSMVAIPSCCLRPVCLTGLIKSSTPFMACQWMANMAVGLRLGLDILPAREPPFQVQPSGLVPARLVAGP
jgi:hypothetical protein